MVQRKESWKPQMQTPHTSAYYLDLVFLNLTLKKVNTLYHLKLSKQTSKKLLFDIL